MNVCILTSTFPTDDADPLGRFIYDFCLTLTQKNNVTVITQKRAQQYQINPKIKLIAFDWKGKDIPLADLKLYKINHLYYMISLFYNAKKTLDDYVKNNKVDYCFALWAIPSGIGAYYLFRKNKTPFDVWCLGSDIWKHKDSFFTKSLLKKILKAAKNVYADGYNFSRDIENLSGRGCKFLPSSRKLPPPEQRNEPSNKKIFLFIGRYHQNKGPDILIQAIALIPKKVNADCEFIFYGKGPLKEQLLNATAKLNLKNTVINDIIDTNHIANAFSKAHFLIIPSRLDSIPVILSDALQGMIPMIGADVGDLGDIIRIQKIGYVFERGSAVALSEMIVKAFYDRKEDYYENIRNAMKTFSVDNAVAEFEGNLKI